MTGEPSFAKKHHLETSIDPDVQISSVSRWGDVRWVLDSKTAGLGPSSTSIRWDFELDDGSRFDAPEHRILLDTMRRFIWSLFTDNRGRRNLKPTGLANVAKSLRYFIRWVVSAGIETIDQFDRQAGTLYIQDLSRSDDFRLEDTLNSNNNTASAEAESTPEDISFGQAGSRLRVPYWLFQQSAVLARSGIRPMPEHPFGGSELMDIVNSIQRQQESTVLPIPSQVSLPILKAALRLLGTPAEDVIRLLNLYYHLRAEARVSSTGQPDHRFIATGLAAFQFSTVPGEEAPWHAPLQLPVKRSRNSVEYDIIEHGTLVSIAVRDIVAAALIVIQGLIGVRISEVAGLIGTLNPATGYPSCIAVRSSRTGLNDLFYLVGKIYKTTASSIDAEWVCGLRPKGSTIIPPVVHAVMVVERLLRPMRELSNKSQLFIAFVSGGIPVQASSIREAISKNLVYAQRRFIDRHVTIDWAALPRRADCNPFRERGSAALRSHQWRKTWAHFMFAVDHSSLPLISQHFKHLSLAMTEQGYLGNDPELLDLLHEVRLSRTVETFYEAIQGERLIVGSFAQLLEEHRASLKAVIAERPREQGMEALREHLQTHGLLIWFQNLGKCAMTCRPLDAACHRVGGTTSPSNREPNWETRTPTLCTSCPVWFTDHEHADAWKERYMKLRPAVLRQLGHMPEGPYRLYQVRSRQAEGILKLLNQPVPTDEECLNATEKV